MSNISRSVYGSLMVLMLSVGYITFLLYYPQSNMYMIHQDDQQTAIDRLTVIAPDTITYTDPPPKDQVRTIGYPALINLFMLSVNGVLLMIIFNCFIAAWTFFVLHQMIGDRAWILILLGAFIPYTPFILSDLLFSSLVITSIWQIRKKLWLHFLLLGLASLIRPSLEWFFVIEPAVLYFYGYRGRILIYSVFIMFGVTCFNSLRNFINHDQWSPTSILNYIRTADIYFGGAGNKIQYMIKTFTGNCLGSHYNFTALMFGKYYNTPWRELGIIMALINVGIWIRFGINIIERKVNWGNVIILIYFIGPSLLASSGGRMRLPVEWILLI